MAAPRAIVAYSTIQKQIHFLCKYTQRTAAAGARCRARQLRLLLVVRRFKQTNKYCRRGIGLFLRHIPHKNDEKTHYYHQSFVNEEKSVAAIITTNYHDC